MSLLDENANIRQITDEVTGNINKVDPSAVVQSILADIQGIDRFFFGLLIDFFYLLIDLVWDLLSLLLYTTSIRSNFFL